LIIDYDIDDDDFVERGRQTKKKTKGRKFIDDILV